MEDDAEHGHLVPGRHISIGLVEGILLQKSLAENLGRFDHQLLIVRKDVGTDELDNLHQLGFLMQKPHDTPAQIVEIFSEILLIPGDHVVVILGI